MANPPKTWLITAGRRSQPAPPPAEVPFVNLFLNAAVSDVPTGNPSSTTTLTQGFTYSGGLLNQVIGQAGNVVYTLGTPATLNGGYFKLRIKAQRQGVAGLSPYVRINTSDGSGWLINSGIDSFSGSEPHVIALFKEVVGSGSPVAISPQFTMGSAFRDIVVIDNGSAFGFYIDGVLLSSGPSVQTGPAFGPMTKVAFGASNGEHILLVEVRGLADPADPVPEYSPILTLIGIPPGEVGSPFVGDPTIALVGIPTPGGVGAPTLVFASIISLAGNIPSQETFGIFLEVIPDTPTTGTMVFHFDGNLDSIGTIAATYTGALETSPVKFGSGSMSGGFAGLSSSTTFPAIDGDFNLDFWVYVPTGSDYSYCSFGGSLEIAMFSNTGDPLGDYSPAVTVTSECVMLYSYFSASAVVAPAGVPILDAFNHIEASCTSGVWRLFLNGVLLGSGTDGGTNLPGENVSFGLSSGMVVDEVRIQFGTGGHTSNFTPPTAPY